MTKLLLMRHSQTDHNTENRYCGVCNVSLNFEGIKQSIKLCDEIKDFKVDVVYTSDMIRSIETATTLFSDYELHKTRGLREMDFGDFEGHTYAELKDIYPVLYSKWIDNYSENQIPNGERFIDFCTRVRRTLLMILNKHKGCTIAIVTHGGPVQLILADSFGQSAKEMWKYRQDNAILNIIEYFDAEIPAVHKVNGLVLKG